MPSRLQEENLQRVSAREANPFGTPTTAGGAKIIIPLDRSQNKLAGVTDRFPARLVYSNGSFIAESIQGHGSTRGPSLSLEDIKGLADTLGRPDLLGLPIKKSHDELAELGINIKAVRDGALRELSNDPEFLKLMNQTNTTAGFEMLNRKTDELLQDLTSKAGVSLFTSAEGNDFTVNQKGQFIGGLSENELPTFREFDRSAGIPEGGIRGDQRVAGFSTAVERQLVRKLTKNELLDIFNDDPKLSRLSLKGQDNLAEAYLNPFRGGLGVSESTLNRFNSIIENAVQSYATDQGLSVGGNGQLFTEPITTSLRYPEGEPGGQPTVSIGPTGQKITAGTTERIDQSVRDESERMKEALQQIEDALQRGEITPEQAQVFRTGLQNWDPSKEVNMENIISEFQRIQSETIDPEFSFRIESTIEELQNARGQLERGKEERLRKERASLEARGQTFSGEAVKQLGELAAFGAPGKTVTTPQEGILQKDFQQGLRQLRKVAEQTLGSEKAKQIGFEPLMGGFEGQITQQRAGTEAGVARTLFGQEQARGAQQSPISQQFVPKNLFTV